VAHPDGRVVLFEIGPANGEPVGFHGTSYIRVGTSKTELGKHPEKARALWTRGSDWSAEVCTAASLTDLDPDAVAKAREQFVVKHPGQAASVTGWDDTTFLNKARVLKQGAVTNTALLLLGRPESATLLSPAVAKVYLIQHSAGSGKSNSIAWLAHQLIGLEKDDATVFDSIIVVTDPNKLHDLKAALDGYQVYAATQVDEFAALYLGGAERDRLDPILDACVADYRERLDEDGQVDFKGKAKAFLRTYGFLSSILPYTNADWEKRSIFLTFLVPKLPAPVEEDLSKGILEAIDMDSYRVEKQAAARIQLPDADAEIESVPTTGGGRKPEPELDRLSNILKAFNDQFGNIPWSDTDRVHKLITEDIPNRVAADKAYQNARQNSDKQNARIEHDKALARVMTTVLKDDTELFKQFMDNESFRRWLTDTVFGLTYSQGSGEVAGRR